TYVVVCCGVTPEMLPVTGNTDELIEGTIPTEVAFDVCQLKVIGCPAVILVELAEKATLGGCDVTVTVTDCVALPPGPVAVNTYVVVCCGVPSAWSVNPRTDALTEG